MVFLELSQNTIFKLTSQNKLEIKTNKYGLQKSGFIV